MAGTDKTKNNIKADGLDDKTKKQLFDKFVKAGGEVIDENKRRKALVIDREKQKQFQQKLDQQGTKQTAEKNVTSVKAGGEKIPFAKSQTGLGFFNKLKLKFKLKFLGVTNFDCYFFKKKFLKKFNSIYKPAFIEIQVIYLELFGKDPKTGTRIMQRLDKSRTIYYDLIEMIGNCYDQFLFDGIVDSNTGDVLQKLPDLKESLMKIFRALYLLKPYENTIFDSYAKAIDLHGKLTESKTLSYSKMKRNVSSDLYVIFEKFYPRLHWLFCLYYNRMFKFSDKEIGDILEITEVEIPGSREAYRENAIPEKNINENEKTIESSKNDPGISDPVKKGLEMISKIDFVKLRNEIDKAGILKGVSENDKVFLTYLLFCEFDKEFSFILTTNKIKYNVDFSGSGKFDYRQKLNDLYDEMRKPADSFREYTELLTDYEKARKEKPTGGSQYIEYTKRLEGIKKKRDLAGKNARMTIKAFIERISGELKILLDDMNGVQKYIANPQDVLEFSSHIEGQKKMDKKKIFVAIETAYNYLQAFLYRLQPAGDLYGVGEIADENAESAKIQPGASIPAAGQRQDDTGKKSVLDELDDLI